MFNPLNDQSHHQHHHGHYQNDIQFVSMPSFQKFQSIPGVFLKEQLQVLEAVCGINMPCNFEVYPSDFQGNQAGNVPLFLSNEKSECCQRVCLPASCRAYDIHMDSYDPYNPVCGKPFLRLHRAFRCTFLCCNRPEVEVNLVENGQSMYAGKIVNPFYFCNLGVHIFDRAGNLKYMVEGTCCQCGVLCRPWPCESCQTVYFDVKNAAGDVLSQLIKRSQGCLKACLTNCDNFSVVFPNTATVEDKALLTATALLLNYQYFEQTPQEKNQQY